ncbi:MAG: serine/threonine protein kinase, partial [Candidatus Obscuribacterales bacterium]|nr:serine/threonine protein kinase [Candidatus Obscuribacterales bacterium]
APPTDAEVCDLVTLDYNARPTLVPRISTLIVGVLTYASLYLLIGRLWYDVRDYNLGLVVTSLTTAWMYNSAVECLLPNQIRVLDNGIGLGWSNFLFNLTAPIIPWATITEAAFESATERSESLDGSILLTVDKLPKASSFEYSYKFLTAKLWNKKFRSPDYQLRIHVSGIANKADREYLAKSLYDNLPANAVQAEVLRSLDSRFPISIEKRNAFDITCSYLDEQQRKQISRNNLDFETPSNPVDLSEFIPRMARLLPRSIMKEKVRHSLGLKPDEVLDTQLKKADSSPSKTVLVYKPLRMLRPMLDAIERSGPLTFFYIALPIILLGITTQMLELRSFIPVALSVILGVPIVLLFFTLTNPARITLSEAGLRLTWHRGMFKFSCPGIPWSNVSLVSFTKPKKSWAINTTVNFHIQPDAMPVWQRLFYFSFFQPLLSKSNHLRITLVESGLLYGAQSKLFKDALMRFLPPERIDSLLMDHLSPAVESNFTSLWLSSLTKERVRIEPLEAGDLIGDGRYRVVRQIGAGGQGIAYQAACIEGGEDTAERVVLKEFIIPSHAGQTAQAKTLDSVHRECELLQSINHPFVVKMKDSFIEDHRFYLVLEHAQGESLRKLVDENGPLGNLETMELAVQLLGILSHLHTMSPPVIHRDFTPENIIIAEDGTPKLIDFNVARQAESTATRTVVGKHSYIPPEQFRGKASTQSDIYALGASLYFALTGEDPEPISASRPREKNPAVSIRLDENIFRATQPSTEERYKSADEMREDLLLQVPV